MAGCRPTSPSTVPSPQPRLGAEVGREELVGTGQPWLLDALRMARPAYFLNRGPTSLGGDKVPPMVVVVDGFVLPDLEPIRSMPVTDVAEVRRLSPAETWFKYRRSVGVGALEIALRRPLER